MLKKEHLKLLICPTCRRNLEKIEIQKVIVGFHCQECQIIYPIKDDIPIILAEEARNFNLEYPLIEEIAKELPVELHKSIERTLDLLESQKSSLTWEWKDEKFWSREYLKEMIAEVPKNWNDRIWERQFLVKELQIG